MAVATTSLPLVRKGHFSFWAEPSTHQAFDGQIDIRLFTGDDRIRLPGVIVPVAHGGADGWFKIKNLKFSDREITGQAAINFINTPSFRIDRITGEIEISGKSGNFAGQCRKLDPEKDKPQF